MAVIAEGNRTRIYLSPSDEQAAIAQQALPDWEPSGEIPHNPRNFNTPIYGLTTFASLFTKRQLCALNLFSGLIDDVWQLALEDAEAEARNFDQPDSKLPEPRERALAIATFLAFAVDKGANYWSSLCGYNAQRDSVTSTFGRQALPMVWDFTECNPLSNSSGNFMLGVDQAARNVEEVPASGEGGIFNVDAAKNSFPVRPVLISTDPPYYDNINYADLSDFFYIWLRRSLSKLWPDLFRRLSTPKAEELVAAQYRHGGVEQAEAFFMRGMADALRAMENAATDQEPLAIYYAFKQSEMAEDGITSAGWASFLQAICDAQLVVDGTWPIRMEYTTNLKSKMNALSSAVVIVCRKKPADAKTITRADFIRLLKKELPDAINDIRKAGVGPVDMQQSVIGPGMGVFSRQERVLEDDDSPMSVKTALAIINRVWGEIENEADSALDAETQVALAWFASFGFDAKSSGELITLANAKNVPQAALFSSGVFTDLRGRAQLTPREQLPSDWTPQGDKTLTVWECVQHAARVLRAEDGGQEAAARLVAQMPAQVRADARLLSDRLFQIATDKGWSQEALVYNELSTEWHGLTERAQSIADSAPTGPAQATLDL